MGTIRESDVKFTIEVHDEQIPIDEENVGNPEAVDWINYQLGLGNEWAWCTVVVRASLRDTPLVGEDSLGCCSYLSEEDFRTKGGYYEDMKATALADLRTEADRVLEKVRGL